MEFVQTWMRAAGASIAIPVVLLLAASAVAAAGGGLGGLSALGQVTSGPDLPETGGSIAEVSPSDNEIVGVPPGGTTAIASADVTAPAGGVASGSTSPALPGTVTPGGDGDGDGPVIDPGTGIVSPPPTGTPPPAGTLPPSSAPTAPAPQQPAGPVGRILDDTRQIGESLPGPVGPVTGGIFDLLLGPRAQ